jgi:hypothetical protein
MEIELSIQEQWGTGLFMLKAKSKAKRYFYGYNKKKYTSPWSSETLLLDEVVNLKNSFTTELELKGYKVVFTDIIMAKSHELIEGIKWFQKLIKEKYKLKNIVDLDVALKQTNIHEYFFLEPNDNMNRDELMKQYKLLSEHITSMDLEIIKNFKS